MEKTFYIIDDHEMLRLGTISYIENNSEWKSFGSANNAEKAFSDFEHFSSENSFPSILITDLNFYGQDTGFDFLAVEGFPASIPFDNKQGAQFHLLICGETSSAVDAFPAAPDAVPVVRGPGVDHFAVHTAAVLAFHLLILLTGRSGP